jgi:hypothetical protein
MRFFVIAVLVLTLVGAAGAIDRAAVISNGNAYDPQGEPQHGPQNGDGFEVVTQRDATIYYNLAEFLDVLAPGYYFDDFEWLGWGTISGELTYQFGPVNGYSYTAAASNGLYSIPGAVSTNSAEDPLTLTFDGAPVTAVAGDFYATDFDGFPMSTTVNVVLGDGTGVALTYPTTFVGFTSEVEILSLTLTTTTGDGFWPTFDNFYVGSAATVPVEAESWGHIKALYR